MRPWEKTLWRKSKNRGYHKYKIKIEINRVNFSKNKFMTCRKKIGGSWLVQVYIYNITKLYGRNPAKVQRLFIFQCLKIIDRVFIFLFGKDFKFSFFLIMFQMKFKLFEKRLKILGAKNQELFMVPIPFIALMIFYLSQYQTEKHLIWIFLW